MMEIEIETGIGLFGRLSFLERDVSEAHPCTSTRRASHQPIHGGETRRIRNLAICYLPNNCVVQALHCSSVSVCGRMTKKDHPAWKNKF